MEDEICPYATFHLLGFREEMDPNKALNFQTFPHQNGMGGPPGHVGTMGPMGPNGPMPHHMHSRSGSQSMVSASCSMLSLLLPLHLCSNYVQPPLFCLSYSMFNSSSSSNQQPKRHIYTPDTRTLSLSPLLLLLVLVVVRRETRLFNLLSWLATSTEPVREEEQPRWPELDLHARTRVRRPSQLRCPRGRSICEYNERELWTELLFILVLPEQRRYTRVNNQSQYGGGGAEYDDPANCVDYYGAPYDHYGSRKSVGSARIVPNGNGSPEPPLPPPRNHDSSLNDSKESNEISEAECDRDHPRGTYGGKCGSEGGMRVRMLNCDV